MPGFVCLGLRSAVGLRRAVGLRCAVGLAGLSLSLAGLFLPGASPEAIFPHHMPKTTRSQGARAPPPRAGAAHSRHYVTPRRNTCPVATRGQAIGFY